MATKPEGDFQLLDITGRQSEQKYFGGEITSCGAFAQIC